MTRHTPNHKMARPEDHKRMVIFFIAAAVIMALSYIFITKPSMDRLHAEQATEAARASVTPAIEQAAGSTGLKTVTDALTGQKRIAIENEKIQGSFSTKGLRFDDIELKDYYATLEKIDHVRLLAPSDTKGAYFVEVGVLPGNKSVPVPDDNTVWNIISGDKLTAENPVILEWNNGQGIVFRRTITLDQRYVITVSQHVINKTQDKLTLYPYALVSQSHHIPVKGEKVTFEERDSGVQHVGPIAYLNEELHEETYKDVRGEKAGLLYPNSKGWLGMTSKYWMVTLLPANEQVFDGRFAHQKGNEGQDIYQVDLRQHAVIVDPQSETDIPARFFVGAKKLSVLDDYAEQLNIPRFDLSVDFGKFYIITKPLYHFLTWLGDYYRDVFHWNASFAMALLTLTVLIRLCTFPLQNKSYRSMNKMKDLQPKMHALKEKHKDDKQAFQQAIMELYKKEKVNPASGCLPILIQIPIFFSLYKVIYITLDMRHAPFWGWIHDLSAPDPTNVFNLFGLLHYTTPEFLTIGAWPLLYGITMWAQQALNPKPEDQTQQQIFAIMPWIFTFIFAKFPAGLVIYYTWSNLLGVIQQYSVRKLNAAPSTKAGKKADVQA